MAVSWNPTGDFSAILDAGESLTLLRRGGAGRVAIATAWRYADRRAEAEPTGGYVVQADVEWQFEWPADTVLPQLGDRLLDAAGEAYTLLAVEPLRGGTRLKCESRSLRIAHGLDCLVDIQQAVWDGETITDWTIFRPAVHARIQPSSTTVDDTTTSTVLARATLEYPELALDHNHRLVTGDGTTYRVVSYTDAMRIDALPVAVVQRE